MAEARVRAGCVKARLLRATANGDDPDSVESIAERAGKSPRTVYRVMNYPDDKLIQLDLADRLLIASGGILTLDCADDIVE